MKKKTSYKCFSCGEFFGEWELGTISRSRLRDFPLDPPWCRDCERLNDADYCTGTIEIEFDEPVLHGVLDGET